jgi:hypothetical protein
LSNLFISRNFKSFFSELVGAGFAMLVRTLDDDDDDDDDEAGTAGGFPIFEKKWKCRSTAAERKEIICVMRGDESSN